jgi:hypothetical protein
MSSDILTRRPAHSRLLSLIVVTVRGFLCIACSSSLVRILQQL